MRPDIRTANVLPDLEKNRVYIPDDYLSGLLVDDTAFADTWDSVTTKAPSKNAIYDKVIDIVLIGDVHLDGGVSGTFDYGGTPATITFRFDGGVSSTTY